MDPAADVSRSRWTDPIYLNPFAYEHSYDERCLRLFLHVYTDGACRAANTDWLGHAAWGLFVADKHPMNCSGRVRGGWPTSHRAEAYAIVEGLRRIIVPIHFVLDNEGVYKTMLDVRDGRVTQELAAEMEDHDVWEAILWWVAKRGPQNIRVSWVPSHFLDDLPRLAKLREAYSRSWNSEAAAAEATKTDGESAPDERFGRDLKRLTKFLDGGGQVDGVQYRRR